MWHVIVAQHLPWMSVFIVLYKFWILRANFLFSLWRVCTYCKDYCWTCDHDTHACSCVLSGEHQHWLEHHCSYGENFCTVMHVQIVSACGWGRYGYASGLVLLLDIFKNRSSAIGNLNLYSLYIYCSVAVLHKKSNLLSHLWRKIDHLIGVNIIIDKWMHAFRRSYGDYITNIVINSLWTKDNCTN